MTSQHTTTHGNSSPHPNDTHPTAKRNPAAKGTTITIFGLAMLNVAAVAGLSNDSQQSYYGLTSVTYFGLAAIFFLIPVCLVAAELATGWPQRGGVFRWVGEGLGKGLGFAAIFLLLLEVTLMQASGLTNVTDILGFAVNPTDYDKGESWAKNPALWIVLGFGILYYWVLTYLATKGIKVFTSIAKWGVIFATLVPLLLMVVLTIIWLTQGANFDTGMANLVSDNRGIVPEWKGFGTLALAVGVFFSFAGMEMNAAHITDLKKPRTAYPVAILIAAIVSMAIFMIGTVIIAIVVPYGELNAIYSIYTTMYTIGASVGMPWLFTVLAWATIIALGTATISWLAGVPLMLVSAGRGGMLPPKLQKLNRNGMPSLMLFGMAVVVSLIFLLMVILPNIETFFVMLTSTVTLLYLTMYVLLFATFIRLRYTQPNRPRSFAVPGGKVGAWIVGGIGLIATVFGFVLGFFPPAQVSFGSPVVYVGTIVALLALCYIATWAIYRMRKKSWVDPKNDSVPFTWEIHGHTGAATSVSNIPTHILSASQNGMGNPIAHSFPADAMLTVSQLQQLGIDDRTAKKYGVAEGKGNVKSIEIFGVTPEAETAVPAAAAAAAATATVTAPSQLSAPVDGHNGIEDAPREGDKS